jgi:hypothetical protein
MPAGRPSKYNEETISKTQYYLDNYESIGDMIPSIAGLAVYLGIHRDTVYDWSNQIEKQDFSDILGQILAKQEQVLFNKGLTNDFNATIVKLALGKHGYSERQHTEHSGEVTHNMRDITEMSDEELEAELNRDD